MRWCTSNRGKVKIENYRKTVQHLEGGIVQSVLVKSGDRVEKGQLLLKLEEVQADSAVNGLQDQLDAELARGARADAERLLRPALVFSPELQERRKRSARLQSLLSAEAELFAVRRKQLLGQTALLRSQEAQVRTEIAGLQEQIKAGNLNRKLIADELEMNQELFKREFVQRTRLLTIERALAEKDERRGGYDAEQSKAQQKLIELQLKAISLQDDYIKRAADEYSAANRQVLELKERLRPLANTLERREVVAPTAGEIVDLRVHSNGAVITPGEVLMEIVPAERSLLVEAKVRPEDVADLSIGQHVDIQIMAFKQRSTPLLPAKLTYISGDSLTENANGMAMQYYLVQVTLDPAAEKLMPAALSPGMPATVFIQTKPRTALDFLLQPLTESMRRAFREH